MLSQQPPPQGPRDLQPGRATADPPPSHGPGPLSSGETPQPNSPETEVTIVVRHEPYGPTTTLVVARTTTFGEVRRLALSWFKVNSGVAPLYLLAKSGWIVDESLAVGEMELHDLDFFSLGRREDVYLTDEQQRALG